MTEDMTSEERAVVDRRVEITFGGHTPWGPAQYGRQFAPGVREVSTPGHGGLLLDAKRNAMVHPAWRNVDGAYEEDSAWAVVAHTFPDLFIASERKSADESLRDWMPGEYMAITGTKLTAADSFRLAREAFDALHADDFVVVSAIGEDDGSVTCTATRGGIRRNLGAAPCYRVPADEYDARQWQFGFVIDPARHPLIPA